MATSEQIARLTTARNTIRTKLVELGLVESSAKLDACATAVESIDNKGGVSVTVKEGESYTIPKGYHNGSGTVSGVAGGGNYELQSKTVTPTKQQQSVTPDEGSYGLSDVLVEAIPENYQDVTSVTAGASDVLANKTIVSATGEVVAGTMTNNGAVSKTLTADAPSYTVPLGYHDGKGTVKIVPEVKTVTPTKSSHSIEATTGKVLSKVTVNPIPDEYQDVTGVTITAEQALAGSVFVDADGDEVTGTMTNNGAKDITLDVDLNSFTIPKGYHNGEGVVDIVLETKSATPTKSAQNITPTDGKVLSKVTVAAIPAQYITTTDATAAAGDILAGETAYVNGTKLTGTMANNGATNKEMDGLTVTSVTIPYGFTTGGVVSLTNAIEEALAAI